MALLPWCHSWGLKNWFAIHRGSGSSDICIHRCEYTSRPGGCLAPPSPQLSANHKVTVGTERSLGMDHELAGMVSQPS